MPTQALRLSGGDTASVAAFQLPPLDGFGIAMLSAELEYVQKRRSPTQTELDAKVLAKHILSRYSGQVRSCSFTEKHSPSRVYRDGSILFPTLS